MSKEGVKLFQVAQICLYDPIEVLILFSEHLFFRPKAPGQKLVAGSGISNVCLLEQLCEV